jgi:hypothetical protein
VIVNYNKNPEGYKQLFAEASEFLGVTIQDINDYYSHMKTFFETEGGYKFVMFTNEDGVVNESPLVINLDARTITVPAAVSTCASVQKDQLAEMLVFEVDRFFDYMDLANTNIYVQWTSPSAEGSTKVDMMDWISKPGKILFAWPLTEEVTATPGIVKFSVRFFRLNGALEMIYSLNTQEASITIKPALQPDLSDMVVEPVTRGLFENVILNSDKAAQGKALPASPRFGAPGADISLLVRNAAGNYNIVALNEVDGQYVANLVNDTVTFCAQAYTSDLGELDYKWCYITPYKYTEDIFDDKKNLIHKAGDSIIRFYNSIENASLVKDVYIPLSADRLEALRADGAKPEVNERYYIPGESNSWIEYLPTGANFPIDEDTILYERYSAFTVPAEGEVVGEYYVSAVNSKSNGLSTVLNPVHSSKCTLPGPAEIEIKEDLPAAKIIKADTVNTLSVVLPDNIYNADIVYNWLIKTTADGSYVPVTTTIVDSEGDEIDIPVTTPVLTIEDLGWYKVKIVSELNRKDVDKTSVECKVTYAPEKPIVDNATLVDGVLEDRFNLSEGETQDLKVSASVTNKGNPLYNESFEYQWYVADNGAMRPITAADKDIAVANGDTLTVKYNKNDNVAARSFSCIASNVLNGQREASEYLKYPFIVYYE